MDSCINPAEHEPGVPLFELEGKWVAGGGTCVEVSGSTLSMNGMVMPLKLNSDKSRALGYGVYQAVSTDAAAGTATWLAPGPMEVLWRRSDDDEIKDRTQRMKERLHERAAICGGQSFGVSSDSEIVARLNELIFKWREHHLAMVRSCDICPDWTNRAQTGLSVDHVHYVASCMQTDGFRSRRRGHKNAHEVPVLIRETSQTELGSGALKKWQGVSSSIKGFPPYLLEGKTEFYCSLGNGHFSQALNLFRVNACSLWSEKQYLVGEDDALKEALEEGVESIILSQEIPAEDRRFMAEMLNRSHGCCWRICEDGRVELENEQKQQGEQFVALSKVLDAEELSCLVRQELDVKLESGAEGYHSDMSHVVA